MNMQSLLHARERNTKHIPEGTLMNENEILEVLNSTTLAPKCEIIYLASHLHLITYN